MADQKDTIGAFVNRARRDIRAEMEAEFAEREESYAERLENAKNEARKAADEADGQRICSSKDREEMGRRMGEYRRGSLMQLGAVVASAATGAMLGYAFQSNVDVRIKNVPAAAVLGLPGVVLGARLDESLAARAALAVGGTMFSIGTMVYAHCHPQPSEEKV
jgi:hypothetical protein